MQDSKIQKNRIRILVAVIIALGLLVIVRLFWLQVIRAEDAQNKAERQYVTPTGSVFDRGLIYFTDKAGATVAAATIENGFTLAVDPTQITNVEQVYETLAPFLQVDRDTFIARATRKNSRYQEIEKKLTADQAKTITDLKLKGVILARQKWRFYPGETLAAHTIGFVSYGANGDALKGSYGLEEYYNDLLSRTEGDFYVNFFAEIFANIQSVFKNDSVHGDIITVIEPTVQSQLETTITDIQKKWSSESVGGLVMNPHTGAIVAMAGAPTFDLNNYGAEKDQRVYLNILSQGRYEMGSIIKPLVMAAAIDVGAVTPATTYNDTGSIEVRDRTINNFDKRGRGVISMQEVIGQSLNTGMVFAQQKMGKEKFREYMVNRFQLGNRTGIDLPGEVNGQMRGLDGNNDVNFANAAFGQGIATTPINIVRGFSVIANGGYLVTPHLATDIVTQMGGKKKIERSVSTEQLLKPETVATITNMMVKTVDESYGRKLDHYTVAAKTGTAQMARPDGQGYYTDRNMHSLIGFFPASKPEYVLYLFNVHPKGAMYAIQTLGNPFFDMVDFLGSYYAITPDR